MKNLFLVVFSIVSFSNLTNATESIEILKVVSKSSVSKFSFSILSLRSINTSMEYRANDGDGDIGNKNWVASGKEYTLSGIIKGDTIRIFANNNIVEDELDISGKNIKSLYINLYK